MNSSPSRTVIDAPTSARKQDHASNWWRAPQRVWLRRAIFQIHLWLGLVLTLYAVIIGLSGSALVFRDEIEPALHIQAQPGPMHLETSIRAIAAARPDFNAVGLEDFERPGQTATLFMLPKHGPRTANYRLISFDPYTGQVLLDRRRYDGTLGWLTNLHYYLLTGQIGLRASGFMALGLLILCATGLILWWPGVRRWRASLTLRRRVSWKRLNWDLHSAVGFWTLVSLVLFSFTGLYFAFPEPVAKVVVWSTGGGSTMPASRELPPSHPTGTAPRLTIDQALSAVTSFLPADAPAGYLQLPSTPDVPYRATGYYKNTAPFSQLVQVAVDSHTGARLVYNDTRDASRGMQIIQYFFAVHYGSFGGPGLLGIAVKSLWVLLGLVPALLAVTGLLMYWNRKLQPLLRKL